MRQWIHCLAISICYLAYAIAPAQAATPIDLSRFATLNGKPAPIAVWRGKVTVINFWATWCGPCREEIPMLNSLRNSLAARGFEVIGIALDNKVEVNNFINAQRISYPILLGNSDTLNLLEQLDNPSRALPFTLVLDRQGNVVATLLGRLVEKTIKDTVLRYL